MNLVKFGISLTEQKKMTSKELKTWKLVIMNIERKLTRKRLRDQAELANRGK